MIPMAGLIDKEAELARLTRETEKLNKEVGRLSGKLSNPGFTDKAPAKVVQAEQQKLADAKSSWSPVNTGRSARSPIKIALFQQARPQ